MHRAGSIRPGAGPHDAHGAPLPRPLPSSPRLPRELPAAAVAARPGVHVHAHFGANAADRHAHRQPSEGQDHFAVATARSSRTRQALGLGESAASGFRAWRSLGISRRNSMSWSAHADWPKINIIHPASMRRSSVAAPLPRARARCISSASEGTVLLIKAVRRRLAARASPGLRPRQQQRDPAQHRPHREAPSQR